MGVDIQSVIFHIPWLELGVTFACMALYALGLARLTWEHLRIGPIPIGRWTLSGASVFAGMGLLLTLVLSLSTDERLTSLEWALILLTLGIIGFSATRATVAFLVSRHRRQAGTVPHLGSALLFYGIASLSFICVRLVLVAVWLMTGA